MTDHTPDVSVPLWLANDILAFVETSGAQLIPIGAINALRERIARAQTPTPADQGDLVEREQEICDDCPPLDYPTDKTRCRECPRRAVTDYWCHRCGCMDAPRSGAWCARCAEQCAKGPNTGPTWGPNENARAAIAAMPAVGDVERFKAELQAIVHNYKKEPVVWPCDIERIERTLGGRSEVIDEIATLRTQLAERDKVIAKYERVMRPIKFIADSEERAESNASVMINVNRCRDIRDALTPQVPHG